MVHARRDGGGSVTSAADRTTTPTVTPTTTLTATTTTTTPASAGPAPAASGRRLTRIAAAGTTSAPPSAVWALLADAASWSSWSSFDESARLEAGDDGGDGVGALRRFRTGRNVSIERVVAFEPDRHLAYVLVSGLPLRDYRADVTLTPTTAGGTAIGWRSQFRGKVPGTGWLYGLALRTFLRRLVRQLAAAAEAPPA